MLNELKKEQTDRQKVIDWLNHIKEFDEATRSEVLEQCAKDREARAYFVMRSNEVNNA